MSNDSFKSCGRAKIIFASVPKLSAALCVLSVLLVIALCGRQAYARESSQSVASQVDARQGILLKDVPEKIDRGAKYLFYLHGAIVENEGVRPVSPDYGVYEYQEILDAFVSRGFVVISERRPRGTNAQQYALKVVGQVKRLLKAGVPPRQVTIVGASRGGSITLLVSTWLKSREVNFVILASCGDSSVYRDTKVDLWGNVLSIYDYKDTTGAGTCQKFFDAATGLKRRKEIVVELGLGHGLLYRPLKEWVGPTIKWANQK